MSNRIPFLSLVFFSLLLFNISLANVSADQDCSRIVEAKKSERVDNWRGMDKAKHLLLSASLAGASYEIRRDGFHDKKDRPSYSSTGFAFNLGSGKEIYDEIRPQKKFSCQDLAYDLLGIGAGALIASG